METTAPKQINVTKTRAIELAMKYRRGSEPLTETVQRLLERYDATQAQAAPAAPVPHADQPLPAGGAPLDASA